MADSPLTGAVLAIRYVKLTDAVLWDRNPKVHDWSALTASIKKYGFRDAPIYDATLGAIAAGNGRIRALQMLFEAGGDPPLGIATDAEGAWYVPVQFGIDAKSRAVAEAFAVDHNNLTMAGFSLAEQARLWESDEYADLLLELREADELPVSVDSAGLDEWLQMMANADEPEHTDRDAEPADPNDALREKWGVEVGDIWELAAPDGRRHRLAVGDSTDGDTIGRLMAGEKAVCMWTDPPYGVSYVGKTKDALTIENDGADDLPEFLAKAFAVADGALTDGAPVYVAHPAGPLQMAFNEAFTSVGWLFHETLTWVKNVMVLVHSDYHYQHEPVMYGWKRGAVRSWYAGRDQVSVFFVDRPSRSTMHPTMKPPPLITAHLANSTKARDLVYEPFGGSGSTMVACEQLRRRCHACELSANYAAVILERMSEAFPELEIRRVDEIEDYQPIIVADGTGMPVERPVVTKADVPDAIWPSDDFGIPILDLALQADAADVPVMVWGGYGSNRKKSKMPGTWLFYTEDYRFDSLWDDPTPVVNSGCVNAAEVNFSCYNQMPPAQWLWQIYRKRWIARYWQSRGVRIFVDLNVYAGAYEYNMLGVPAGWKAYATRGYTDRLDWTEQEYAMALERAGTAEGLLFLVYGGGAEVRARCKERGWLWIPEGRDVLKGRYAAEAQRGDYSKDGDG